MKNIEKLLPIQGWRAVAVDYTDKTITIKYNHEDLSYLLCPRTHHPMAINSRHRILVRDLPLGVYHVVLDVEIVECWCHECQRCHSIRPDELHYSMSLTWRLMWHISWLVKEGTCPDVAKSVGISESSVRRADKVVLEVIDYNTPLYTGKLESIIIDEKYLGKRLKFVTVVMSTTGEVLYLGAGKSETALEGFWKMLCKREKRAIKVVCIDRGNAYQKAVRKHLPNAKICFDHFHVISNVNEAVTKVRRQCFKKNDADSKLLKGKQWLLLRAAEDLSEDAKALLDKLLSCNEDVQKAYILKEQLRAMYLCGTVKEARKMLKAWIKLALKSGLQPFVKLAESLKKAKEEILNYFRYHLTSGKIESLNSKISKIQFKMRGVADLQHLYLKLRQTSCPEFLRQLAPAA